MSAAIRMTPYEREKLDAITHACPGLGITLGLHEKSYVLTGTRTDGVVLVRIENASLAEGERQFKRSYARAAGAGMLGSAAKAGAA